MNINVKIHLAAKHLTVTDVRSNILSLLEILLHAAKLSKNLRICTRMQRRARAPRIFAKLFDARAVFCQLASHAYIAPRLACALPTDSR